MKKGKRRSWNERETVRGESLYGREASRKSKMGIEKEHLARRSKMLDNDKGVCLEGRVRKGRE